MQEQKVWQRGCLRKRVWRQERALQRKRVWQCGCLQEGVQRQWVLQCG